MFTWASGFLGTKGSQFFSLTAFSFKNSPSLNSFSEDFSAIRNVNRYIISGSVSAAPGSQVLPVLSRPKEHRRDTASTFPRKTCIGPA